MSNFETAVAMQQLTNHPTDTSATTVLQWKNGVLHADSAEMF
jgi:hypothetical protein